MIKKISAILLALVLCLAVVVFPASAVAELNGTQVAYALEWDKEYYNAGDTATLYLYLAVQDDIPLESGTLTIALNSAFISPDDNYPADCVTAGDVCASYFKDISDDTYTAQSNSTYQGKIEAQNTAEENATYDWYLRIALNKNGSGDHPNCANNKDGLYGSEIDPTVPFITYTFTVAEGVEDGSVIPAAITSGSSKCSPSQLQLKYYSKPGTGTNKTAIAADQYDVSAAVATATVGTPAAAGLAVSYWKDQIRFQADNAGAYAGKFDYRMLATIDGFADIFDDVADAKDTSDNDGILEAGFIFSKSGTVDKDAAIAQINGGAATYSAVTNAYVSTSFGGKEYVMACYVGNIADADVDTALSALGYVKYMVDGETKVATFDAAQTSTFRTLYDKNASNKPA